MPENDYQPDMIDMMGEEELRTYLRLSLVGAEKSLHESRKFYHPNGSWGIHKNAEEVIELRIQAVKENEALRKFIKSLECACYETFNSENKDFVTLVVCGRCKALSKTK